MAIPEYNYIPTYIKRTISNKPKDVVTASYWNELFNLLITQGDHTAEELGNILNHFTTVITDLANDTSQSTSGLSDKLGNLNNLATTDKTSLVASINEVKNTTDTKQDKLIAGKNINIAEDGKTISATSDMDDVIGYFRVTLTERGDGLYTGSKTFAQVKAEIESNKRFMFIDGYDCVLIVTRVGNAIIEFAGMSDGTDGWLWVGVASDDRWEIVPEVRITLDWYNNLANDIGKLTNLTTTDKTNLVAAVNEVKGIADGKQDTINDLEAIRTGAAKGATALQSVPNTYRTAEAQNIIDNTKQDKLIAGENITIAADGKTISATGGGVLPVTLTLGAPIQLSNGTAMYYTADRSRDEIKSAIDAGITVLECSLILADNPNEVANVLYLNFSLMDSSAFFVGFDSSQYVVLSFPITSSVEGMLKFMTLPTGGGSDIETVESQLVDIPSKLSQFTNDAGYLTIDTLPKYDGSVIAE